MVESFRGISKISIRDLYKKIQKNPENIEPIIICGNLLHDKQRPVEEAMNEYTKIIDKNSESAKTCDNALDIEEKIKQIKETVEKYRKIEYSKIAEVHNTHLKNISAELERGENTVKNYEEAIRNLELAEAHFNIGNLLLYLKRFEEAEKQYKEATRLNPNYAEAHNNLGALYDMLGDPSKAADEYEKAIKTDKNDIFIYIKNFMGNMYKNIKKAKEEEEKNKIRLDRVLKNQTPFKKYPDGYYESIRNIYV